MKPTAFLLIFFINISFSLGQTIVLKTHKIGWANKNDFITTTEKEYEKIWIFTIYSSSYTLYSPDGQTKIFRIDESNENETGTVLIESENEEPRVITIISKQLPKLTIIDETGSTYFDIFDFYIY